MIKKIFNKACKIINKPFSKLFGSYLMDQAIKSPQSIYLELARKVNGIQLTKNQLLAVIEVLQSKPSCKFLVFGLGNDSVLWEGVNKNGETLFLEDNKVWIDVVTKKNPQLDVLAVNYYTQRSQWRDLIDKPEKLEMKLPEEVLKTEWDVILVDAPEGWADHTPGRMNSIYMATKLARPEVDVFIDDCMREVEIEYSDRFLTNECLVKTIDSKDRSLRHYSV